MVGALVVIVAALLFVQTRQANNLNLQSQCATQAEKALNNFEQEAPGYNSHSRPSLTNMSFKAIP